jgi:hypothetical protein
MTSPVPVGAQKKQAFPGPFAMAEPGFLLALKGCTSGGHRCQRKGTAMKAGVSCVALGFGLFTATLVALAQTTSPSFVAQAPSSTPPSGVLAAPPAAPVSVPPSGVLTTVERRAGNAPPIKTTQNAHNQRHAPVTMRRHVAYHPTASRRGRSKQRTILALNECRSAQITT